MKASFAVQLRIKQEVARHGRITPICLEMSTSAKLTRTEFEGAVRLGLALFDERTRSSQPRRAA
jgi:hypothetical protein